jgi:hypothetical protein
LEGKDRGDSAGDLSDLRLLLSMATEHESLESFLSNLSSEPPDESQNASDSADNHVVLSTIHSAKGLECSTVFVINVSEGCLPSTHSLERDDLLEEERSLLFVAGTRAKRELFLLAPKSLERSWSGNGCGRIFLSRFLGEIKDLHKLTEWWKGGPGGRRGAKKAYSGQREPDGKAMVYRPQPEGQLWISHPQKDMGVSPEGYLWCIPAGADGLLQPPNPEANTRLPLHPA